MATLQSGDQSDRWKMALPENLMCHSKIYQQHGRIIARQVTIWTNRAAWMPD
jgi:hypothetical protein